MTTLKERVGEKVLFEGVVYVVKDDGGGKLILENDKSIVDVAAPT